MNSHSISAAQLEKYSSAMTLSDMEIFIFPELLYSLVLANIMSPRIWKWRENPWFEKIDSMKPYRRVLRLKQFIIDNYEFNLDLETWGLTTREKELERFAPWMDEKTIGMSNALFGYQGDQYYFDLDIRRHFGLDRYDSNVIPYWKTETVEAMDAFRFQDRYKSGAGECVSLSALYAAALFIVCRIPLEDIFLMATPLHSQNFVDVADGILTNNRRVVTKNMWFNGTELTAKAQRALRHEQVTLVAHSTGYIHIVYPDATIDRSAYERMEQRLCDFLSTGVSVEILANFLRQNSSLQKCFQIMHTFRDKPRYIPAEIVYHYEHSSSFKVGDRTRENLLLEIDEDEYFAQPLEGRIPFNKFERFFREHSVDLTRKQDVELLAREFNCYNTKASDIIKDLMDFVRLKPRLPSTEKTFVPSAPIELGVEMSREQIIEKLESVRADNPVADLSFYAFRDFSRIDSAPFMKAAMERNPVSIRATVGKTDDEVVSALAELAPESIYDGARLAQPDEVWNYRRGDGFERALCLANIWKSRHPGKPLRLSLADGRAVLDMDGTAVEWQTGKVREGSWDLGARNSQ